MSTSNINEMFLSLLCFSTFFFCSTIIFFLALVTYEQLRTKLEKKSEHVTQNPSVSKTTINQLWTVTLFFTNVFCLIARVVDNFLGSCLV